MILINLFFLVSSDRIDPDYGLDDGTKIRFRGSQSPIPRFAFSRDLLGFLIVLLVQGIYERFLQRILHRLHEFCFLFRGRGAEIVDVEWDRRLRRQPGLEYVRAHDWITAFLYHQLVLEIRNRHDPAIFEFVA